MSGSWARRFATRQCGGPMSWLAPWGTGLGEDDAARGIPRGYPLASRIRGTDSKIDIEPHEIGQRYIGRGFGWWGRRSKATWRRVIRHLPASLGPLRPATFAGIGGQLAVENENGGEARLPGGGRTITGQPIQPGAAPPQRLSKKLRPDERDLRDRTFGWKQERRGPAAKGVFAAASIHTPAAQGQRMGLRQRPQNWGRSWAHTTNKVICLVGDGGNALRDRRVRDRAVEPLAVRVPVSCSKILFLGRFAAFDERTSNTLFYHAYGTEFTTPERSAVQPGTVPMLAKSLRPSRRPGESTPTIWRPR